VKAIEQLADRLAVYAAGMVAAEKQRRLGDKSPATTHKG
jgi:hypothetical protein